MPQSGDVTHWLQGYDAEDRALLDHIYPLLYDELRRLARNHIQQEREGHTLDTTGLVHESFLKLAASGRIVLHNRKHFFRLASRTMRFILVDHARARKRAKRGGGDADVTFDEAVVLPDQQADEILALDEALEKLSSLSERLSQVVEHRYFAGLSVAETAQVMGIAERTVKRDWQKARALLSAHLQPPPAS